MDVEIEARAVVADLEFVLGRRGGSGEWRGREGGGEEEAREGG